MTQGLEKVEEAARAAGTEVVPPDTKFTFDYKGERLTVEGYAHVNVKEGWAWFPPNHRMRLDVLLSFRQQGAPVREEQGPKCERCGGAAAFIYEGVCGLCLSGLIRNARRPDARVNVVLCDYSQCGDGSDSGMIKVEGVIEDFTLTCVRCGKQADVQASRNMGEMDGTSSNFQVLISCGHCFEGDIVSKGQNP